VTTGPTRGRADGKPARRRPRRPSAARPPSARLPFTAPPAALHGDIPVAPDRVVDAEATAEPAPEAIERTQPTDRPAFAHASEAEMARILDFYDVRWEYEPHTFPILWNLEGDVVESFSPDFWLPDLDLYLEMTTLRQKLVRKKNRKLRRVLALYPDLRVKLFYARDFRQIMLKYGKLALADELSGANGQVVPERPAREPAEAAPPEGRRR
jgi:hypothetical protein